LVGQKSWRALQREKEEKKGGETLTRAGESVDNDRPGRRKMVVCHKRQKKKDSGPSGGEKDGRTSN